MYFVFVKAISTVLYPIFSSIITISAGLALKRFRRRLGYALVVVGLSYLYLCSTYQFSNWLARKVESGYAYIDIVDIAQADAIVILGGGVRRSGGMLELNDSADRVLQGARLLKADKASFVIVSAGSGYGGNPHGEAMSEFLRELGVADDRIVEETQAQNTYEHTVYLKSIFEEHGVRSVILVTSAWHMRRSMAVFESQLGEYEIIAYPVDSLRGKTHSIVDFLPTAEALSKSTFIIKEYVGYLIYDVKGWIR